MAEIKDLEMVSVGDVGDQGQENQTALKSGTRVEHKAFLEVSVCAPKPRRWDARTEICYSDISTLQLSSTLGLLFKHHGKLRAYPFNSAC